MINIDFFTLLKDNRFVIKEKQSSDYFGDYELIWSNGIYELRIVSDRSQLGFDIKKVGKKAWYDLELLMIIMGYKKEFLTKTNEEDILFFLKKEISSLNYLFSNKKYKSTAKRMEEIMNERVKLIFPNL